MKQINKIAEPQSLVQHRANQPATYDGLPFQTKEDLRQNLLSEQGHICCYCMKRIPEKVEKDGHTSYDMKIEHYRCQYAHADLDLTYSNLFGACTGNEGMPKKLQTCDTKKGSDELAINLLTNAPVCESLFKYNAEGEMSSINDDGNINRQINTVLNLNMQSLKDARSEVYLQVQKEVEAASGKYDNKQLKLNYFIREKQNWLNRTGNKHRPFCMVAVYYLDKKIRQYQN